MPPSKSVLAEVAILREKVDGEKAPSVVGVGAVPSIFCRKLIFA